MKNSHWRKYLSLGVNVFYNEYEDLSGNVGGQSTITGPNTGDGFLLTDSRYPTPRLTTGLALGVGIERDLWEWGLLQVGAVCNLGFQDVAVWDLELTTWDISQNIDGVTYRNTIVNKGSYAGIRVSVLSKL